MKRGVRETTSVSLIDVMPTILDWVNLKVPKHVSGISLKSSLQGGTIPAVPVYAESELAFLESRCAPLRSITTGKWKYIDTTQAELYDLSADPNETVNLASTHPKQVREFENLLDAVCGKMHPTTADAVNLSPDDKQILASLGYVTGPTANEFVRDNNRLPDVKEMLPYYVKLSAARHQAAQGRIDVAIEMIRSILNEAAGYSTARLYLGDLLVRQKQFDQALQEYAAVAREQPDNAEAHSSWANVLAAKGEFQESVTHYRKAIEIDPDAAPYHYYYSFTLTRLGQSSAALKELEQAIRCYPGFVEARLQLGKLLAESGRVTEASAQYAAASKYRRNLPRQPLIETPQNPKRP